MSIYIKAGKILFLLLFPLALLGQQPSPVDTVPPRPQGAAVMLDDTLFSLFGNLGPFGAEQRAAAVNERLDELRSDPFFNADSLYLADNELSTDIYHKRRIIVSVTDADARMYGISRAELAADWLQVLKKRLEEVNQKRTTLNLILEILLAILVVVVFYFLIKGVNRLFEKIYEKIEGQRGKRLKSISIKSYELLDEERLVKVTTFMARILKIATIILLIYLLLPIVFSIFPWTKGIAGTLFSYIWAPFKKILLGFFGYLPNLITILVIFFVTRYVVKFFKFLSSEVRRGKLKIEGFYPEWAQPTFNIVRFLLYVFMFIMIFPYLPGSDSPVFQGVSVFLGLLISLGSSSAIANIVAGLVITYMRPFRIGDRVKIGDTVGDVVEKNLLVTRVRTIKNEDITIPNSSVLSNHSVNYSSLARKQGVILYTTITIGYDVPWKQVHELLTSAAEKTDFIMKDPKPFVLQTSLDDFYVSYQLNAYTMKPNQMAEIYSHLHEHIQDAFNEAGVEIMSSHYSAIRDGNQVTIPFNYLPEDYKRPNFKVGPE